MAQAESKEGVKWVVEKLTKKGTVGEYVGVMGMLTYQGEKTCGPSNADPKGGSLLLNSYSTTSSFT